MPAGLLRIAARPLDAFQSACTFGLVLVIVAALTEIPAPAVNEPLPIFFRTWPWKSTSPFMAMLTPDGVSPLTATRLLAPALTSPGQVCTFDSRLLYCEAV